MGALLHSVYCGFHVVLSDVIPINRRISSLPANSIKKLVGLLFSDGIAPRIIFPSNHIDVPIIRFSLMTGTIDVSRCSWSYTVKSAAVTRSTYLTNSLALVSWVGVTLYVCSAAGFNNFKIIKTSGVSGFVLSSKLVNVSDNVTSEEG